MPEELISLLAPILACGFNVIVHILICNVAGGNVLIRSLGISYVFGAALLLAMEYGVILNYDFDGWRLIANVLIYTALVYTYFHFNNMLRTARRVRLVIELYHSEGGLTHAELAKRYPVDEILNNRIRRLSASGQIREESDRIYINGYLLVVVAMIINAIKNVLR